ncbi:hypothetical protein CFAM422_003117 [Trichoderma lentiforme]|uniref:Uncharacterized protein n=1 Tax=Trichoderma lentiforme TaxID=1567552 RepID=A0A9P4XLI7_9HYPO|nr:hypothetical protein CFAM422_003117 [Trichoderma lentiforme]
MADDSRKMQRERRGGDCRLVLGPGGGQDVVEWARRGGGREENGGSDADEVEDEEEEMGKIGKIEDGGGGERLFLAA